MKNSKSKGTKSTFSEEIRKTLYIMILQLTELGGMVFYIIIMGLFLFIDQKMFIELLVSLIAITIVAVAIKYFFFTPRPVAQSTDSIVERLDASSFPSIHSMRAFTLTFWLSIFFNKIWIAIYLCVIAILVITSRVNLKKHYLRDVIGGVIIAAIIVFLQTVLLK